MKYLFYGCGKNLKFTMEKFEVDYSNIEFTDSNYMLWGKEYLGGKMIKSPKEIVVEEYSHCIIGSEDNNEEIRKELIKLGFSEKIIVPFQYIRTLWERWKKTLFHVSWKNQTQTENISIMKNWYMNSYDAECVIGISNCIDYNIEILAFDIYKQPHQIEIFDLCKNEIIAKGSTRNKIIFSIDERNIIIKIRIKNAISGIPWLTIQSEEKDILNEINQCKLGEQFIKVYSELQSFPYYDEDYLVLDAMRNAGGIVLDVGANYGQSLYSFYRLTNSKIMSFEVRPDLYEVLLFLKKKIDYDDRVDIINSGVSDKEEYLIWYEPVVPYMCGSFDANFIRGRKLGVDIKTKKMKCMPLDDLIKNHRDIWFIKMDVEGLEYEAIKGARDIISLNHPAILVEQNDKIPQIKEMLKDEYDIYYYDLYANKFKEERISRLNCWLIPKEEYRSDYVKKLVLGKI